MYVLLTGFDERTGAAMTGGRDRGPACGSALTATRGPGRAHAVVTTVGAPADRWAGDDRRFSW